MLTRIASGGMAEVWLARSSSIGGFEKLLAIKKMHSTLSTNQSFISMFIDEAKLTVSLSHPNIVQIFDFGRVDDDYFMAMEYVEGFDLATLAKRARKQARPLPVDMCTYIMRAVFDGLAYAHGRTDRYGRPAGIIHRDVSPQNVLVSFDGHVKVGDFGIARAISNAENTARPGEIFGKLAYLSPEQARGEVVTASTDLWAAGVMMHELLANQRLFLKENDRETMEAVAGMVVPSPRSINPDVPPELAALVLRVLEREPARRPANAREVAMALGEIVAKHFPAASEYRLTDVISSMWDHHLPRLLPAADERELTRDARPPSQMSAVAAAENTKPVGERTAAEIAAVARRIKGVDGSAWAHPADAHPLEVARARHVPRAESITRQELGASLIADLGAELHTEQTVAQNLLLPTAREAEALSEIAELKAQFVHDPSLWVIVDIGRAYQRAGMSTKAMGAFKLAAAKFAQRGLLIQAATIYCMMLGRLRDDQINEAFRDEIKRLRTFQGMPDEEILTEVFNSPDDSADFSEFRDVFVATHEPIDIFSESPILSSLNAEQLVGLVQALKLRTFDLGEVLVSEGEPGDSFFMIGRGRVLVSTTNYAGQKIYVTSLSDGDCFGEHGFFTGEPRTASVEALEEVMVLEVSKEVLNRLVVEFPTVRESLRRFYKERIAESLLAKSPLFGQLSTSLRKMFAERFTFETYEPADLIIREGDQSDAFYAIKAGRVLVYTGPEETAITLAELGPGDIFGEVAALEGTVRTASVRAMSDCEILRLEASELNALLARNIEIRRMIEEKIEARAEERLRKIIESA